MIITHDLSKLTSMGQSMRMPTGSTKQLVENTVMRRHPCHVAPDGLNFFLNISLGIGTT